MGLHQTIFKKKKNYICTNPTQTFLCCGSPAVGFDGSNSLRFVGHIVNVEKTSGSWEELVGELWNLRSGYLWGS